MPTPRLSWQLALLLLCSLLLACDKRKADIQAEPTPAAAGASSSTQAASSAPVPDPAANPRRIIRTGELSVETDAPEAVVRKLSVLAEDKGGFVISSDISRWKDADGAETVSTTLVFRVPVAAFDDALAAVRALGSRVATEKVTGQDVTEEYVDLEARVRAQRAIEEQYVKILGDAKSIPDVLAVQQKLGEVRTEIERAEGRRRFLESQTSLSTITVHVARHLEAIDTGGPGFGRSLREAMRDSVAVGIAIVNGAIRTVGVLLPVGLLLGVPGWLLLRSWRRRRALRAA
jgi:hypothetical protein